MAEPAHPPGEALARSEERFRMMVEGSEQVFFYIHDPAHRVVYLSPSVLDVLGHPPEYYVGNPYEVMLADPSDEVVAQLTDEALRRGTGRSTYLMRGRHKDGRLVVLEIVESPLVQDGRVIGMHGFARDITARVSAEEALQKSDATLRALVDASPLAIVAIDREGKVEIWNPAAERLFGWRESEVVGSISPQVPAARRDELRELRERALLGGARSVTLETQRLRKDGSTVDVSLSAAALYESEGAWRGLMGIYTDTTERKRLEDQVRQAQKMEVVGQLAGGIAHDFNNILTVIVSYSGLLRDALSADDVRREDVEEIQKAADFASSLTRQLLAFSRRQVIQPRVLDLNQLVARMDKMLHRLIGADVQLATKLAPNLGRVLADAGQLEQVLMNLVVNARDAMPGGGTLTIETHNSPEADPPHVILQVTDSGAGMTAETKAHLFEPFFTTKEVGKGTGLGLATVYGIVKQTGGEIDVTSELGVGTTFRISIPRVKQLARHDSTEPKLAATRGTETVLLVEDNDAVRRLAVRALETTGYHVLEAPSGEDALRLADGHTGTIHVVVSDVVMPRMSGREVAERVTAARPATRVLFMSGYADERVRERGLPPGARLLDKPFTAEGLVAAVRGVLDEPAAT